jgi:hypothetical protein
MANWIEGTLKLRGKTEGLKKFFTEYLDPSQNLGEVRTIDEFIKLDFDDVNQCYNVDIKDLPHIKGSRRAFLEKDLNGWLGDWDTIALKVKQAWNFDVEPFVAISKECGLDVRLFGFECGIQFCQEIEIIGGEVICDKTIKYDDWIWDCPMPLLGG